jgi:hypothetical protein
MAGKGSGGGKVGRSSESGRFVPVKYAEKHPRTTEIEKIQPPKKK